MRTLVITLGGFALGALMLGLTAASGGSRAALGWASAAFLTLWLAVAGINLWLGVSRAGYSLREELPIFVVIFGLPALAALLLRWKLA